MLIGDNINPGNI